MKKNFRLDMKSNVVCFSFNTFLSHSKEITVYSNPIDIVFSPAIFIMPSSVNLYNNHVCTSIKEIYSPSRGEDYNNLGYLG